MQIPSVPEYDFSYSQLVSLHNIVALTGSTREAFKSYWLTEEGEFSTEQVEDFAIAFMSAYNRFFPRTY